MAELSDDTLSDDDALGARHGGGLPFVFGWANNMARWGQQDLDDTDAAVADAYNGSASFGYLAQQRAGQPAWLLERAVRVPRAEVATPAPSMADAAFRAALVGDVFGYYPLAYKIRVASVVSKEALKYVRGRPLDLTKIRGSRSWYDCSPKRFRADAARALIEGGTWRVSGLALDQLITRATVRSLPLANVTNLDLSYMRPDRLNGPNYQDKSRLKTLDCLSACPALRRLVLANRFGIRDLAPIASLQQLEELILFECVNVTDISPLASCPKLATLDLSMCHGLGDSALEQLASISSLRTLRLMYCNIHRLPDLVSLTSLDLTHCQFLNLSDCGLGEQLKTLSLRWEDGPNGRPGGEQSGVIIAGDLAPLARCTRLTSLDLSNASNVGSLEPLALLPLETLSLQAIYTGEYEYPTTELVDLTPLAQIGTLVHLNLNYIGGHVSPDALAVVRGLLKLETLELHGSGKENRGFQRFYHLAGHPTLRKLDMGHALLTDADLTFLPSLPELTDLGITLTNLPKSMIEDVAKRCPKLINLSGWI